MSNQTFPENFGRTIDGRIYKSYAYLQRENRRSGIPIMNWSEFLKWNQDKRAELEALFNDWESSGYQSDKLPLVGRKTHTAGYLAYNAFWTSRADLKKPPKIVMACSVCNTDLDQHYNNGIWIMCSEFSK